MNDSSVKQNLNAEAKAFLQQHGLLGAQLMEAARTDDKGHVFNSEIALSNLTEGLSADVERQRATHIVARLQRAIAPEHSRRWATLITRRKGQLLAAATSAVQEMLTALEAQTHTHVLTYLRALLAVCEQEHQWLATHQADIAAKLKQGAYV